MGRTSCYKMDPPLQLVNGCQNTPGTHQGFPHRNLRMGICVCCLPRQSQLATPLNLSLWIESNSSIIIKTGIPE